jgi:hypothetical protein
MVNNIVGGPARGSDFFNREQEVREILEHTRDGNHLLLLAPRRMGKTSLLYHLKKVGGDHGLRCAYESVADLRDENAFLGRIVRACLLSGEPAAVEAFRRLQRGPFQELFTLFRETVDSITIEKFTLKLRELKPEQSESLAREVARALRELPGDWLLILDELPVFVLTLWRLDPTGQRARDFLTWFRELRQGGPDGHPVRWVLAGSIGLDTVTRRLRAAAAINDLRAYPLGPFSPQAADACSHWVPLITWTSPRRCCSESGSDWCGLAPTPSRRCSVRSAPAAKTSASFPRPPRWTRRSRTCWATPTAPISTTGTSA